MFFFRHILIGDSWVGVKVYALLKCKTSELTVGINKY